MDAPPVREPEPDVAAHADRADDALVRDYRDGDEDAARALYRKYAARLGGLARRHAPPAYAGRFDADDVVQAVFRTFFHGVRARSYDVPGGGEVWGLLAVLAVNEVRNLIDYHRAGRRAVRQTWSGTDLDRYPACPGDESARAFFRLVLDEQLGALPESSRTIVELRMDGHEVEEISARTGRSRRTVERVLHDFRARLVRP